MNIYSIKKPKRFNSVSVALALIALAGVYSIWAFIPVFWPLWQMSGIMRSTCNIAYNESNDQKVMTQMLAEARRTKLRVSADNFRFERVPYPDQEVMDAVPGRRPIMQRYGQECRLEFRYADTYSLPLFGVEYYLPYESTVSVDLRRNSKQTNVLNDFFYNACTCTSVRPRS